MLDAETTSRIGSGPHSIGIEIDPDYCRMIQTRLRSENQNLFSSARLEFTAAAKASEGAAIVREEPEKYSSKGTIKRKRK